MDSLKLAAALAVVIAAVAAYYYYADLHKLLRALIVVGSVGVAAVIALQTERGRGLVEFTRDAQIEVRKVVWPTRQETVQTTLIVIAVVIAVGLFLWGLDSLLGWITRSLMS